MTEAATPPDALCPRWYVPTPSRALLGLLLIEGLLFASDYFRWLPWHKGYAVLTTLAVVVCAMALMVLWFVVALMFRKRFQFSLRSLLLLVVVVALPCSWLASEMQAIRRQRDAVARIEKEGFVKWSASPTSLWLQNLLPPHYFDTVESVTIVVSGVSDAELARLLKVLPDTKRLNLGRCFNLTDAGLECVAGLDQLESLWLGRGTSPS